MDTGSLKLESRESRSEKVRFQQSSISRRHLDDFPNNLEQLSVQPGLNPDLVQVRNVKNADMLYDPSASSSEMLNFAANSGVILSTKRAPLTEQEDLSLGQTSKRVTVQDSNMSDLVLTNFSSSPETSANVDPLCCGDWRSLDSQHSYDWTMSCASGSVVGRESNQKSLFVGGVLSNNSSASNFSTSAQCLKPCNYNGYQDVGFQCTLTNPLSEIYDQDIQKQYCKDMQFASHSLHNSTSQDVCYASVEGNQLVLLSSCGNQSTGHLQSNREFEVIANDANTQGLCLSLSSNPSSNQEASQFGEGSCESGCQAKAGGVCTNHQNFTLGRSSYLCPIAKPSIISKSYEKSLHDIVGTTSTYVCRDTGPLGPFTGYASILKSSRFLMPAHELLDEFCSVAGSKLMKLLEVSSTKRVSEEVSASVSADVVNAAGTVPGVRDNNGSGILWPTFHSLSEGNVDGRTGSSSCESYRPECHQEKARLLYLQDEVCRRYKQYHQHMQMVASSFESVAGLSTATPYISAALKTVTRNFRCLKHAISNHLMHITKALGEDFLSPNTGASSSKCETSTSRLRFIDQGFQKHKFGRANASFLEPHVWRPQRGLPERAVAVLRAWLFEHFLHPYPTDADKHMLATQTGLSRNQVSNWFINARVRVWKPMVEEIHMLETKNLAETKQTSVEVDGNSATSMGQPNKDQRSNKTATSSTIDNKQFGCSSRRTSMAEQRGQQKKTRVDFQIPTTVDGSLMNVLPYQRSAIDIGGGLGAVTLTLGLRHGVENVQKQHQQQDNQLTGQFGSQMIHDFVG